MTIVQANPESIARAAALLRDGKLVAFPTETVYGLGGDATNDIAVAAIYAAKGRPQINPLIVHTAEANALNNLIEWNDRARELATRFWPGPLTMVLPRRANCPISLLASAGMNTLAVRVPSHPIARQLIEQTGKPIAAPSANTSGKLSPTTAQHVAESLGDKVDLILAGGKSQVGLESTVINMTSSIPQILRPGGITKAQLESVLGRIEIFEAAANDQPLPSPGMLASHYAPNIKLRMNATSAEADEALLLFGPDMLKGGAVRLNLSLTGDVDEAAANLFAMLRELDQPGLRAIAVASVPNEGLGLAINDRLRRAST